MVGNWGWLQRSQWFDKKRLAHPQHTEENKILGLVFSRDRAMQLDCALRSFFLHCTDAREARLFVIYKATTDLHGRQYAQLAQEYDEVCFLKQKKFRWDVLDLLLQFASDRPAGYVPRPLLTFCGLSGVPCNISLHDPSRSVLFMVDDNVFVRKFSLLQVHKSLIEQQDALGFSLRLGTNTTYCYSLDKAQALPTFASLDGQVLKFNWTRHVDGDFSYPLEVSSSVYRVSELVPLLTSLFFNNPNALEGNMANRAGRFRKRFPYLLCYTRSVTFCNPVNVVQSVYSNRAREGSEYSTERLTELFEEGYRINVNSYRDFVSNACHQDKELVFERN